MTSRRTLAVGALAAAVATAVAALSPAVFSLFDLRIYDAMLRAADTAAPSDRVAIVAIDDRSLSEIGQWPWPRQVLARLIDRVHALGASAIAIDLLIAEPDRFARGDAPAVSPGDAALAAAAAEGPVVIGYAFTFGPGNRSDGGCIVHPLDVSLVQDSAGRSPVDQLFHATGVVCSLRSLSESAGASGYLNASPDRDGLLRRIPLIMALDGAIYPSLALAAVAQVDGAWRVELAGLAGGRSRLILNDRSVPLDARGTLLVRFRGGRETYPHISAADILNGRVGAARLRDRIVFVGSTALGVQDVVSTPRDIAMPGIEVHATAADTLLRGDYVSTPSYGRAYELAGTMGLALAVAAVVGAGGLVYGAVTTAALIALLWWATFLAVSRGVFLSPVFPTMGAVLVLAVLTFAKVRDEWMRAEAERGRREQAHHFAVESLTSLVESRDGATGQHARRTQTYSRLLALRLSSHPRFRAELTPERIQLISQLSPLHDIGKVGVRDAVLNKPGALSVTERDEIRRHPVFGHETIERAERLAGSNGRELLLEIAKDIVYTHHERWDGGGYPRGLKGDEIPVAGRIVAVVDVYDALCSTRIYRAGVGHDEAVATIAAGRGTQFDPDVVDAFLTVADQFRALSQSPEPARQ